ncbi:hypothetical protein BDN70DRAFT_882087 [Pholiota conissans]|uniref:XLF-like N-terminal domain-containing protein n=1 Tax=Pholiota conissans TaxID=109636 RepID=A0A9P5YY55_9AGAR|nr:hypothetical protein BDN70DRAFT_882087 [Pholiota conissans]
MEQFTEEHAKHLLDKDWLSKVDAGSSTPYLMKFYPSLADLSCVIMVTDTKKVWAEVVTAKLLARRWRLHNARSPEYFFQSGKEDTWRESILDLLCKAHTIGGIGELSFEVVESKYSDLCIEVECEAFKWRWETCFIGYQSSSEIISKHLVFPLISLNHLTFSAAEPISEMSDADVEKTIDKLGRTARRTVDTHIKNALSKPRVATSISRTTAMFNFVADLPRVTSIAEKPLLEMIEVEVDGISPPKSTRGTSKSNDSSKAAIEPSTVPREAATKLQEVDSDSKTESDDDLPPPVNKAVSRANSAGPSKTAESARLRQPLRLQTPSQPARTETKATSSDSDSPQRPIKKIRPAGPDSSDDDSENAQKKTGAFAPGVKRGTRQPIKRGGKRF